MNIRENAYVTVSYRLRLNDHKGDIIETIDQDHPLQFIYGQGNVLPSFEKKLESLVPGSSFLFTLASEEAYGDIREEAIVDVPLTSFEINGQVDTEMIRVGKTVPMRDHHGNRMNGKITRINDTFVTMDFNHPLAGRDLYFEGEIIAVREAAEHELNSLAAGTCGCGSDCNCQDDCDCNPEGEAYKTGRSNCGCGGHH